MAGRGRAAREQFWREVIRDQQASGLSISAFCRQRKVSPASFFAWRRKLTAGDGENVANKFAPIQLARPVAAAGQPGFEVALPNGLRVHVPPEFDADALGELLAVLKEQAC